MRRIGKARRIGRRLCFQVQMYEWDRLVEGEIGSQFQHHHHDDGTNFLFSLLLVFVFKTIILNEWAHLEFLDLGAFVERGVGGHHGPNFLFS
jgi:hypothetical protein